MAEPVVVPAPDAERPRVPGVRAEPRPGPLAPYRAVLASRLRAQLQYRASFAVDVLSSMSVGVVELAEVLILLHTVPSLTGLTLLQQLLVFALADVTFALSDLLFGHLDAIPDLLQAGTLEVLFTRPLPVLAQLATSDLSLKRFGRAAVSLVVMAYALPRSGVAATGEHVGIVLLAVVCGMVIFTSLFLAAGAVQFWLVQGAEFTNAFVYGGHYVAQFAIGVVATPLQSFFTFVVPTAFVSYVPVLALTGRTGPFGLGVHTVWALPLAAVIVLTVALAAWSRGIRHYTGAGG